AVAAYRRAVELCDRDAYVHHNLAVLYEQAGDMQAAARHNRRAAELAPDRYGQGQVRGTYNEELRQCQDDGEAGRWQGCAMHCQNALDSGERLNPEERRAIEQFRDTCRYNAEVTGQ
ncbi:MAG: tetratricopeptide repeat protein, partial [Candidatus Aenigmatarchaeota archaeon]